MYNWLRRFFSRSNARQHTTFRLNKAQEFVVIGLGRFGSSVASTLHAQGYDVLGIDGDERLVQRLANELPHVVHADATNKEALLELGVDTFDTGIVCIGSDFESNILATVLLRQFGVRRVICKARTRTQQNILLTLGADQVILPEQEAGHQLARALVSSRLVDLMEISQDINVVELITPEYLVNRTLAKSNLREKYGVVVIAIRRQDKAIMLPSAQETIQKDDILVVMGDPKDCEQLLK